MFIFFSVVWACKQVLQLGGSHLMTPMLRLGQVGETTFNVVPPYEVASWGLHILQGR